MTRNIQKTPSPVSGSVSSSVFVNSYNFLPIAPVEDDPVTLRHFESEGSHWQDRFQENTYSGRLVAEITTESEFFIGAGKLEDKRPAKLKPYELDGKPAIPPTSLKGMISSVMEAASNSALRVLEKSVYTRRQDFKNETLRKIGLIVSRPDEEGKSRLFILPLKAEPEISEKPFPEYQPSNLDERYPVYLDGYNRKRGEEIGLLKNRPKLQDFSAEPKFFYLDITKIDSDKKVIKRRKKYFFLGYQLSDSNDFPFITSKEFESKSEAEKPNYRKGLFKILGIGPHRRENIPRTKKHEMFLFCPVSPEQYSEADLITAAEAIENFHCLSDDRSQYNDLKDFIAERLPYSPRCRERQKDQGQDVLRIKENDVVYYEDDGHGKATKISFSACWRDFCGSTKSDNHAHGYFKLVDRNGFLLPPCLVKQGGRQPEHLKLTPADALLGFVEEEKQRDLPAALALAGRLFFSPGILSPGQDPTNVRGEEKTLKILAGPKPPCPEFYFHRENRSGRFITKQELEPNGAYLPNGRKFYWHNQNPEPYTSDQEYIDKNVKQLSRINPITPNTKFLFAIDFFNLSEFELGMLLYSLRPTSEFRHRLGLGKPLGLGKIKIDLLNLLFVNRKKRYVEDDLFSPAFFHSQTGTKTERISELGDALNREGRDFDRQRFCAIANQESDLRIKPLISIFKKKIQELYGENWLTPLENLGDPASTEGLEVRYPPHPDTGGYEESFKWWMRNAGNDKDENRQTIPGAKKTLAAIPSKPGKAPTLPSNPRR